MPNKTSQSMLEYEEEKSARASRKRAGSLSKAALMLGMDPSFEDDYAGE